MQNDIENTTRQLFRRVVSAWANGDLETSLRYLSDDVEHMLNVDGDVAPFAATVIGKVAIRKKLRLLLDTFEIGALVTDYLIVSGHTLRAQMKQIYIHRKTGQRLKTNFRFVITQRDGLMVRIEEYHDAPYVEAFARLVDAE